MIEAACLRGRSTFYGTGMNPGLAQILTIVHSTDVAEIEHVLSVESVDVSCHHSVDTWVEVGFGRSVDDPAVPGMLEKYTRVFEDAVRLMADCFRLELGRGSLRVRVGSVHQGRGSRLVSAAQRALWVAATSSTSGLSMVSRGLRCTSSGK